MYVEMNLSNLCEDTTSPHNQSRVARIACYLAQEATLGLLLCFKDAKEALPNITWFAAGINTLPNTSLLIVAYDRRSLFVVCFEALL